MVVALVLVGLSSVGWIATGLYRAVFDQKDWANFQIPKDSRQVKCDIRFYYNGVSLCSREQRPITDVLVEVNGEYLYKAPDLQPNKCVEAALTRFRKPDWRRIRAKENLLISIAALAGKMGNESVHCYVLSVPEGVR